MNVDWPNRSGEQFIDIIRTISEALSFEDGARWQTKIEDRVNLLADTLAHPAHPSLRGTGFIETALPSWRASRFWYCDRSMFFQSTFGSFLSLRLQVEIGQMPALRVLAKALIFSPSSRTDSPLLKCR